jgi:hypothetical protein
VCPVIITKYEGAAQIHQISKTPNLKDTNEFQ